MASHSSQQPGRPAAPINSGAAASDPHAALPGALRSLAERGDLRNYRKGTLILEEGSQGELLYLLLRGRVKVFSMDQREREITYGVYGPGDYFGEMSLDGGPRSASVIALEPTRCAVVTRRSLHLHIAQHPEFAFELLTRVIRRARLATANARSLALLDVYGRLVQALEGLAQVQADGSRLVPERLTHADLASRIGCSREMVSRLLKDLQRGGHIWPQGRQWVLAARLPARW
jgi:CRP/FNR family transcriptional regulator, cyclic AMP receptor protein